MTPTAPLRRNEENEAAAFDRLADRLDRSALVTSESTFRRYRSAVLGRPVHHAYPDLMFARIGAVLRRPGDDGKPLAGVRVFDLGAGDGIWSVIFAEQGALVGSVEISPGQVERARERMRRHGLNWDARVGSAYALGDQFASGSYDLVFAQAILHHLTFDLERVCEGIDHLLRPGGLATMMEPYCGSRRLRRLRERLAWLVPCDRESPDERPLEDGDLSLLARRFPRLTVERYDLLARVARRVVRSARLEKALFRLDRSLLGTRALAHLAGGVFIAARK